MYTCRSRLKKGKRNDVKGRLTDAYRQAEDKASEPSNTVSVSDALEQCAKASKHGRLCLPKTPRAFWATRALHRWHSKFGLSISLDTQVPRQFYEVLACKVRASVRPPKDALGK